MCRGIDLCWRARYNFPMGKMNILIAADHGGVTLKETLKSHFDQYNWIDLGTQAGESVDYPDYAAKLAKALEEGQADFGVLICGSGIGISIAANRFDHVRCALCTDVTMAQLSREHNHANVLSLGERLTGELTAIEITRAFLETMPDEGDRHKRRVEKLSHTHKL
jgi:ribose 5-phosphate isomerase B